MNTHNEFVPIKKVTVVKLDEPSVITRYDKNKVPYTVELNYTLKIEYPGDSISMYCSDLDDVLQKIDSHKRLYSPSWESVTCNGRWSCD